MIRSILMAAAMTAAALFWAPRADAEMVLADQTTLVKYTSADTIALTLDGPGILTARIGDTRFTALLSSLTLTISDARGYVAGIGSDSRTCGPGTCLFELGRGTYFAHLVASAGGRLALGAYTLQLTFVPTIVPLPPALLLLATGLGLLGFGARRRRAAA